MAGPPSSAFSQLTMLYSGAGLRFPAVTTHGFTTSEAPLGDVTDAILDFKSFLMSSLSSNITCTGVLWKVGPEATGPTVLISTNEPGGDTSPGAPPNLAYLVRLTAGGFSGRLAGRFYLPGLTEAAVDVNGVLDTDKVEQLQDNCESAYTALEAVDMEPRIFPVNSSDPRTVTNLEVQPIAATQRRRMRR